MVLHIQEIGPPLFGDRGELTLAAGGADVSRGDLLSYDGTNIALADADAAATFAHFIALRAGKGATADPDHGSNAIAVTRKARLYDTAAGFTANAPLYLSGTAGSYTQTRPTGAQDLIQVVGWAFTTEYAEIDIPAPKELVVIGQEAILEGTAARLINDTGPAAGVTLAAAADDVTYAVPIPVNAVAITDAHFNYGCDVTLDSSDTVSVALASTGAGLANDVSTDTIAATGLSCTADELAEFDLSGGVDGLTVYPGGVLFIDITKVAEGTAGDDPIIFPPHVVFRVV